MARSASVSESASPTGSSTNVVSPGSSTRVNTVRLLGLKESRASPLIGPLKRTV
jgi:hypothetical protein